MMLFYTEHQNFLLQNVLSHVGSTLQCLFYQASSRN